ncbi:MAG TPA: hypothetical protein VF887_00730, partial [Gemmatimonadaceae bacterium]
MNPRVISQPLGGNLLAATVIGGSAPDSWYETAPRNVSSWRKRIESVRTGFAEDWLTPLAPAFEASGRAKERL